MVDTNKSYASRSEATFRYMVSIHKSQVKDYVTKTELDVVITTLKMAIPSLHFLNYNYELGGKYRQLHFHGIAETKQLIRYTKYSKIEGFRVFWKRIFNMKGAQKYVKKDSQKMNLDQTLVENYYNNHYGFIGDETDVSQGELENHQGLEDADVSCTFD